MLIYFRVTPRACLQCSDVSLVNVRVMKGFFNTWTGGDTSFTDVSGRPGRTRL